ncbi:MAG TPA: SMC-Scp complex subunit ScpB [Parachlamydiaceae bacterium]|nr:SMC-Scp complex subunit ScpB [Parachlamydiaceae bacterium]
MAKEFNLFDQQYETKSADAQVATKTKNEQPILPGILENIQAAQRAQQQEKFIRQHAKRIIEALLFSSSDPLHFNKIREIVDSFQPLKPRLLRDLINELQQEYLSQQRAFRLEEIAEGFLLRTCEEYSPFIDLIYRNKRSEKLSQASAEVLAIIAYRQPITRPQIEAIRGVDCSGIVQNLLERQLIEPAGRMEAPGRPTLYETTNDFLKHFGLRSAQDLSNKSISESTEV